MVLLWALAGTMGAEKTWRRLMGKADMPKLVTPLRRLDLLRVTPATAKRAGQASALLHKTLAASVVLCNAMV